MFKEQRLIFKGGSVGRGSSGASGRAAQSAGRASVAAARAAAPGHAPARGQAGIGVYSNPQDAAIASRASSLYATMTDAEKAQLQKQANATVDPYFDTDEGFLKQMLAIKTADYDAKLQQVKDAEALNFRKVSQTVDRGTSDALQKEFTAQYADKGGGTEYGEGSGVYRGYADEEVYDRNLAVKDAQDQENAAVSTAQQARDYNVANVGLQSEQDILADENARQAARAVRSQQLQQDQQQSYDLLQSQSLGTGVPATTTPGYSLPTGGYNDSYTRRVAARYSQDATGVTAAGYPTSVISPPPF